MSLSRRKRKRYRAREQSHPEATAQKGPQQPSLRPRPWGVWGEGTELTRGDLALIRLAVNCDWPVRRCMRRQVTAAIMAGFDQHNERPANRDSTRWTLAATRTVIAMGAADIRLRHRLRALVAHSTKPCGCDYCRAAREAQARLRSTRLA